MTEKPMSLDDLHGHIAQWQRETFPNATLPGVAAHLLSEAVELARAAGVNPVEVADIVIKALDKPTGSVMKESADVEHLLVGICELYDIERVDNLRIVLEQNKRRTWKGENEHGFIEHDKESR